MTASARDPGEVHSLEVLGPSVPDRRLAGRVAPYASPPPAPLRETLHVLGHIGINVPDLDAAREYYARLMPLVEFELFVDDADQFAYRPASGKPGTYLFFYPSREHHPYSRHDTTGLQHLAFMVRTRAAVTDVHRWAVESGSEVLHAPRAFPEYPPPYFATFWLDPFGMMLEAVCHYDR